MPKGQPTPAMNLTEDGETIELSLPVVDWQ